MFWCGNMEWNIEENFSMEWEMELKIFSMEWKKIATMEYRKMSSIPFHALLLGFGKLVCAQKIGNVLIANN